MFEHKQKRAYLIWWNSNRMTKELENNGEKTEWIYATEIKTWKTNHKKTKKKLQKRAQKTTRIIENL